ERIGRRHHWPGPYAESAERHARIVVHSVDLADAEAIHQAAIDHFPAATAALFRRLDDHHCSTGKVARLGEIARRTEKHGCMPVVTAGVHFAGHRGLVRNVVRFLDRQRIHVGAQPDRLPGGSFTAADNPDHASAAKASHYLIATESLEFFGYGTGSSVHVEQQLGMGMQIAPPAGDFAVQIRDTVDDRHDVPPWTAPV